MIDLRSADDRARFGGKAAELARALVAGLPVPPGFAVPVEEIDAAASGGAPLALPEGVWAVRASAVAADAGGAAPARIASGYVLNVATAGVPAAIRRVRDAARAAGEPAVAAIVQRMVIADVAGRLYTRDPATGEDARVIEAAWGLGDAVVDGLVTPDRWRVARDGAVLDFTPGAKSVMVRAVAGGGTAEAPVPIERVRAPCLDTLALAAIDVLVRAVEAAFPGPSAVEFAFDAGAALWVVRRRPIA